MEGNNQQPQQTSPSIDELMRKKAEIEGTQQNNVNVQETPVQQSSDQQGDKPVLVTDTPGEIKGVIINHNEADKTPAIIPGALPPQTEEAVHRYMANMENDFAQYPELLKQMTVNQGIHGEQMVFNKPSEAETTQQQQAQTQQLPQTTQVQTPTTPVPQYQTDNSRVESSTLMQTNKETNPDLAIVLIDKIGLGNVIGFTNEERQKLERAKRIRVEEVETVSLKTIKKKKPATKNADQILQRRSLPFMSHIVNPVSGYLSVMKGCSSFEVLGLMEESGNAIMNMQKRWSLIYDKMVSSSIGISKNRSNPNDPDDNEGFNDFLRKTAALDYDNFIFGIICATHPDKDKLEINCANAQCPGKTFEHEYTVKSLIQYKKMNMKLIELIKAAVDNSHAVSMAKMYTETAPLKVISAFELPNSKFVIEMGLESAYDFIYSSIKKISEDIEPKFQQAAVLSTTVLAVNVPDPDQDPEAEETEYIEYTDRDEITKFIYSLNETDLKILAGKNEEMIDGLTIEYGLDHVQCPHCKHMHDYIPINNIEDLLFLRHQRAMSTTLE